MIKSRMAGAVLAGALLFAASGAAAQDVGATGGTGGGGGVRIAVQARIDGLNLVGAETGFDVGGGGGFQLISFMPLITGGVRMDRLFLGAGFGFYGFSYEDCEGSSCDDGSSTSASGWSLAPMVQFDLLSEREAAGYLLASLTLASVGATSTEDIRTGMTTDDADAIFVWGLNLGVGVRGKITDGIAIGTEWGWGFATWSDNRDEDDSAFIHGIFGTLMFEASVGL